ncbi:MAG: DbpA RNA binding domain-containing protein [Longimicrobiales bacterium]
MSSFDELGVSEELVEALAAEGIERPSAFQDSAIPVLLRGNSLMAQAGPGAGTLVAYGVPLLQSVDPEADSPTALVLTPTPQAAHHLGQSLARLAQVTGHRVAALGSPWALPKLASILFSSPEDFLREVEGSGISGEGIQILVVDGYGAFLPTARAALETLMEILPAEGQRIVLGQPVSKEADAFAKAHLHRAVHLPPRAAEKGSKEAPPRRGEVAYRLTGEGKETEALRAVLERLEGGAHHVLLFFHSEDQAADVGDFLALHGFLAGAPGEGDFPVWLGVEELEARRTADDWPDAAPVVTVSFDVPTDPDSLDRRHGGREGGLILVRSRELLHLKDLAERTGYRLVPAREPVPTKVLGELDRLRDLLERTIREEELAPHYLALEPLFQDFSPGEVAAAALALLQKKQVPRRPGAVTAPDGSDGARSTTPPPKTWVRLFVGVGEKESIGPGDLLGAISGEAGVEGSQVGKIEIRETFSLVEVLSGVAEKVIKGLNGTTIRGRSVRCDYDRGGPAGRGAGGSRGGRPSVRGSQPKGRGGQDGPRRRPKGEGPRGHG